MNGKEQGEVSPVEVHGRLADFLPAGAGCEIALDSLNQQVLGVFLVQRFFRRGPVGEAHVNLREPYLVLGRADARDVEQQVLFARGQVVVHDLVLEGDGLLTALAVVAMLVHGGLDEFVFAVNERTVDDVGRPVRMDGSEQLYGGLSVGRRDLCPAANEGHVRVRTIGEIEVLAHSVGFSFVVDKKS